VGYAYFIKQEQLVKETKMVKAISTAAEAVLDFFMISKFGPAIFVVGVMALLGFGGPALASLFH
jgi:hypothetical protein